MKTNWTSEFIDWDKNCDKYKNFWDLNKRKMINDSVDGWGFVITAYNFNKKNLEYFKELKKLKIKILG